MLYLLSRDYIAEDSSPHNALPVRSRQVVNNHATGTFDQLNYLCTDEVLPSPARTADSWHVQLSTGQHSRIIDQFYYQQPAPLRRTRNIQTKHTCYMIASLRKAFESAGAAIHVNATITSTFNEHSTPRRILKTLQHRVST
eukprot:5965203-Amphidinium_carterae.1